MKSKFILPVAVLAALALALVPAVSGARSSAIKVKCTASLVNHDAAPGTTGDYFGFITCSHGVGKGVQYIHANQTIGQTVAATGTTKAYFDLGTISANFSASGPFSTSAPIPLTGSAKITGGSADYRRAKGSATVSCSTPDLGKTLICTESITLTRL